MSTETNAPYSWLRSLPPSLFEVDEVPLAGKTTPFPWQRFVEGIIKQFELSKLTMAPKEWKWVDSHELFSGISGDPHLIRIGLSGYEGNAIFAFDKKDLQDAIYHFILHRSPEAMQLDEVYEKAFYQLFTVAFCEQFTALNWEKGLNPFILPESPLEPETMLAMDIVAETAERTFTARLFLDNALRQSWKEKHLLPFEVSQNKSLAEKLILPVSIEGGYFNMKKREWEAVKPGDFVLLDGCTIDSDFQQGSLLLRVYDTPYYKAQLSEGNIILEEQPSYSEIESTMPKNDDDSDFDFDEESEVEHEETEKEDSDFNFDDDSDFDFDEESEVEDDSAEHTITESHAEETPTPTPKAKPEAHAPAAAPVAKPASGKQTAVEQTHAKSAATPKDIPLHIVVEVGRFQMTVEKMMELQPGNMLNLQVRPEDGVDLVVNGRRIGKGELLKFGETLGVRITEIG